VPFDLEREHLEVATTDSARDLARLDRGVDGRVEVAEMQGHGGSTVEKARVHLALGNPFEEPLSRCRPAARHREIAPQERAHGNQTRGPRRAHHVALFDEHRVRPLASHGRTIEIVRRPRRVRERIEFGGVEVRRIQGAKKPIDLGPIVPLQRHSRALPNRLELLIHKVSQSRTQGLHQARRQLAHPSRPRSAERRIHRRAAVAAPPSVRGG
jgi:hypothetical protein